MGATADTTSTAIDRSSPRAPRPKRGPFSKASALVGLLFLATVVLVVWHHGDARRFAALAKDARPAWLAVAAALELATYACAGGVWWIGLRRADKPQPLALLFRLAIAKLFTDQVLPSGGITGTLLLVRSLVRRGTPRGLAAAAFVVNLIGFYTAFITCAVLAWLVLWLKNLGNDVLLALIGGLVILSLAIPGFALVLLRRGSTRVHRWASRSSSVRALLGAFAEAPRDKIKDPTLLAGAYMLQLLNIFLDAATLWVMLRAVGVDAPLTVAFAGFVFAMIAEVVGFAPGGLGTFEGTSVGVLHIQGVGVEPALAATLLFRGFTFWLPMIPGFLLSRRELANDDARAE
jgi:uncharacterized protein (TIRG00374 family)